MQANAPDPSTTSSGFAAGLGLTIAAVPFTLAAGALVVSLHHTVFSTGVFTKSF